MRAYALLLFSTLTACGVIGMSAQQQAQLTAFQQNAKLYYDGGNFDQALHQIRRGLDLDPDNYNLLQLRAWCFLRMARNNKTLVERAIAEFDSLMALRSIDSHGPQTLLGFALLQQYLGQEQQDQADVLQEEIGRIEAGGPEALGKKARMGEHLERAAARYEQARTMLQELLDRGDVVLLARFHAMQNEALTMKLQRALGNEEAARHHYELALAHGGDYLQRLEREQRRMREVYEQTRDIAQEQTLQMELQALIDDELKGRDYLANLYFNNGDYAAAVAQQDRILTLDPTRSVDYYNRGRSLEMLGRPSEAKRDFERFLATTRLPEGNPRISHAVKFVSDHR